MKHEELFFLFLFILRSDSLLFEDAAEDFCSSENSKIKATCI